MLITTSWRYIFTIHSRILFKQNVDNRSYNAGNKYIQVKERMGVENHFEAADKKKLTPPECCKYRFYWVLKNRNAVNNCLAGLSF